jgi:sterol desaturase/sphingolipid hydroxylase (fatty acid hydroxylase superfamily)
MEELAYSLNLASHLQQIEFVLLIAMMLLLISLESVPALRSRDFGRGRAGHLLRNGGVWLIGAIAVTVLLSAIVLPTAGWIEARRVGVFFAFPLPAWAVALAGIVLIDAADYLFHRLSHEARWLWRLHALHHSDPVLDVSTNIRSHPAHVALAVGWRLVVLAALGFPQWVAVLKDILALPVALWGHANVGFPERLDRLMRGVFVTPAMHRVHHSPVVTETDSNYGGLFSFWDRAFGTYTLPQPGEPARYGLDSVSAADAASVSGMLRTPWRVARAESSR